MLCDLPWIVNRSSIVHITLTIKHATTVPPIGHCMHVSYFKVPLLFKDEVELDPMVLIDELSLPTSNMEVVQQSGSEDEVQYCTDHEVRNYSM